mgnify:CR=1 FL=1
MDILLVETAKNWLINKIKFDNISEEAIKTLIKPSYSNIMKVAIDYSDALIIGSEEIPSDLQEHLDNSKKPTLEYHGLDTFAEAYTEFYNTKVLS